MRATADESEGLLAFSSPTPIAANQIVAQVLDEVADLLTLQNAKPYRALAYRHAAGVVRGLDVPVETLLEQGGVEGLTRLRGIGPVIARALEEIVRTGRLRRLDWLRGHTDPEEIFATIPGVGPVLARRIHDQLGVHSLEDLEMAAHDGRLGRIPGFGPRRVRALRALLADRLSRRHLRAMGGGRPLPIRDLLDVDRQYRAQAEAGVLHLVTPRRFNPHRRAWLPVLHTDRGSHHYTVLFSNTAQAHALGKTHDWVVIYAEDDGAERQATVVTEHRGPLRGRRVVRGRERECLEYYAARGEVVAPPTVSASCGRSDTHGPDRTMSATSVPP